MRECIKKENGDVEETTLLLSKHNNYNFISSDINIDGIVLK